MRATDEDLIRAYTSFNITADRIAASLPLRREYLAALSIPSDEPEGDDAIWRLLQLRKRGKLPKGHSSRN